MKELLAMLALAGLVAQASAAEPIRIGVVNEISGPQAEAGRFTLNGIRLALDEVNKAGGVLGRSIELRVEDNGSTNPGTVLALSKLASDTNRVAGIPTMIDGIEPVLLQGYTANSQDFTPIVLAVKKSGSDILGSYFTTAPDQGIFAKQMRQLGVNIAWVGSPALIAVSALSLAGEALHGTYAIADFTLGASDLTRSFGQKYRERYGINPDTYASWAYDAAHVLANAMRNAGSTDAEAVRSAIPGLKGFRGVEGAYEFDESGDGLHGYNVVRNDKGAITFMKRVDFPAR